MVQILQDPVGIVFEFIFDGLVHELESFGIGCIHEFDWLKVHDPVRETVQLNHELLHFLLLALFC